MHHIAEVFPDSFYKAAQVGQEVLKQCYDDCKNQNHQVQQCNKWIKSCHERKSHTVSKSGFATFEAQPHLLVQKADVLLQKFQQVFF